MYRVLALAVVFAIFGVGVQTTSAHQPKVIGTPDQHDVLAITDPEISRAIYGELINHPHTFEIVTAEPFHLFVELLVPDIDETHDNISGIVLEMLESGSVREVTRLHAKDASWESFYEPFGGDWYRRGPQFETDLPPGRYRIEVSTPDNVGKYVLAVGAEEDFEGVGYFETVQEIARVKVFFGKSQFAVAQSPFVYVPLVGLVFIVLAVRFVRRKMKGV